MAVPSRGLAALSAMRRRCSVRDIRSPWRGGIAVELALADFLLVELEHLHGVAPVVAA